MTGLETNTLVQTQSGPSSAQPVSCTSLAFTKASANDTEHHLNSYWIVSLMIQDLILHRHIRSTTQRLPYFLAPEPLHNSIGPSFPLAS